MVLHPQYDIVGERLTQALRLADVSATKARLASLQHDASSDSIWDDPTRAQGLLTEISSLKDELAEIDRCGLASDAYNWQAWHRHHAITGKRWAIEYT